MVVHLPFDLVESLRQGCDGALYLVELPSHFEVLGRVRCLAGRIGAVFGSHEHPTCRIRHQETFRLEQVDCPLGRVRGDAVAQGELTSGRKPLAWAVLAVLDGLAQVAGHLEVRRPWVVPIHAAHAVRLGGRGSPSHPDAASGLRKLLPQVTLRQIEREEL